MAGTPRPEIQIEVDAARSAHRPATPPRADVRLPRLRPGGNAQVSTIVNENHFNHRPDGGQQLEILAHGGLLHVSYPLPSRPLPTPYVSLFSRFLPRSVSKIIPPTNPLPPVHPFLPSQIQISQKEALHRCAQPLLGGVDDVPHPWEERGSIIRGGIEYLLHAECLSRSVIGVIHRGGGSVNHPNETLTNDELGEAQKDPK